MITVLLLTLAGGLAEVDTSSKTPAPISLMDFLSEDAVEGTGWSGEPERYQRCRLYRCGLPSFKPLEKLRDRADEPNEK
jgi:hypothetical protein